MPTAPPGRGRRRSVPGATAGATDVSSAASGAAAGSGASAAAPAAAVGAAAGRGALLISCCTCSFVSGPRRYDIAQRVAKTRGRESFAETSMNWRFCSAPIDGVERRDVGAARGRAKALEHARLVVLGLQPADEPRAGVRHRLVVEVDRVLGREHEAEPERAALLEDRQDRLLRRRRGGRRHVAGDLVHVRERAQVGGAGLAAHPRDELREDERRHEHPLLVGEVREVDDRRARLALRREEQRLRVERRTLAPARRRRATRSAR